jgi:F0F1-type ATP synthase assembly protein I
LLVVCLLLGFAAGMSNVLRTARRMQAEAEPLQRAAKPVEDDEDDVPPARGGTGSRKPGPG